MMTLVILKEIREELLAEDGSIVRSGDIRISLNPADYRDEMIFKGDLSFKISRGSFQLWYKQDDENTKTIRPIPYALDLRNELRDEITKALFADCVGNSIRQLGRCAPFLSRDLDEYRKQGWHNSACKSKWWIWGSFGPDHCLNRNSDQQSFGGTSKTFRSLWGDKTYPSESPARFFRGTNDEQKMMDQSLNPDVIIDSRDGVEWTDTRLPESCKSGSGQARKRITLLPRIVHDCCLVSELPIRLLRLDDPSIGSENWYKQIGIATNPKVEECTIEAIEKVLACHMAQRKESDVVWMSGEEPTPFRKAAWEEIDSMKKTLEAIGKSLSPDELASIFDQEDFASATQADGENEEEDTIDKESGAVLL